MRSRCSEIAFLLLPSWIFFFLKNWRDLDFYEQKFQETEKFHVRKVKCLVKSTESKLSVWRMETSDDPLSTGVCFFLNVDVLLCTVLCVMMPNPTMESKTWIYLFKVNRAWTSLLTMSSILTRSSSVLKLKSEHDSLHEPLLRLLKAHPNLKYLNNGGLACVPRDLSLLPVLLAKHFHRRVARFSG